MGDRQRAKFAADELAVVLSRYDLGPIESITEFARGSRKSPKVGIVADRGKFLLKRRAPSKASSQRLSYAHQLQAHLRLKGFPLPRLLPPTTDEHEFVLHWNGHVYELFEYVRGQSYNGTAKETREAGQYLARFHAAVADFHVPAPARGDYHDANPVRTALNSIAGTWSSHDSVAGREGEVLGTGQELYDIYEEASGWIERRDLRDRPAEVIHGDWHPGNMLFRNEEIVAVIDYDSARQSQRIVDIANGVLQFSILCAQQVEEWPDEIDEQRAGHFMSGYTAELPIAAEEWACLPYLMVEALIAEAVLPIAATGSFGRYQGFRFMKMVRRKVAWMMQHAERLAETLLQQ